MSLPKSLGKTSVPRISTDGMLDSLFLLSPHDQKVAHANIPMRIVPFTLLETANDSKFNEKAIEIFQYQAQTVQVFKEWLSLNNVDPVHVHHWKNIPFLPISFFKSHFVWPEGEVPQKIFRSSGTTGMLTSQRGVIDSSLYEASFFKAFESFWGSPQQWKILALLPGYLERTDSSLVYMASKLIDVAQDGSGFFLRNLDALYEELLKSKEREQPTILLGVTHALVDFCEKFSSKPIGFENLLVMETGGMKGKGKEWIREELHQRIKNGLGVEKVVSEYGMTELYSQGYTNQQTYFEFPPWVRIQIMDTSDPNQELADGKTGRIRIVDLANQDACCFIETEDLGRAHQNQLEVMGRMDFSEMRGCSLMAIE